MRTYDKVQNIACLASETLDWGERWVPHAFVTPKQNSSILRSVYASVSGWSAQGDPRNALIMGNALRAFILLKFGGHFVHLLKSRSF